jgi:hypothetical protein
LTRIAHLNRMQYLKLYKLPSRCPCCKSSSVDFKWGLYYCKACGYKDNSYLTDPDKIKFASDLMNAQNFGILASKGEEQIPRPENYTLVVDEEGQTA